MGLDLGFVGQEVARAASVALGAAAAGLAKSEPTCPIPLPCPVNVCPAIPECPSLRCPTYHSRAPVRPTLALGPLWSVSPLWPPPFALAWLGEDDPLGMASLGAEMSYAYVRYDEEAEPWHEQSIVAKVSAEASDARWVVYTADKDVYIEDLRVPPLREIRWGGPRPELPAGLGRAFRQPVYRFREPISEDTKRSLRRRASRLVETPATPAATLPEALRHGKLLVLFPTAQHPLGSVFDASGEDAKMGSYVAAEREGEIVVAQFVEEGQESAFFEAARARLGKPAFSR